MWIIAGFVFYVGGRFTLILTFAKRPALRRDSFELMSNALLIGLVGWKLSPLLLSFRTVVQNPLSLVYVPGGVWGTAIGCLIAAGYIMYKLIKKGRISRLFVKPLSVYALSGVLAVLVFTTAVGVFRSNASRFSAEQHGTEFHLATIDGTEMGFSPDDGVTTIINFWASWCPPCRAEIPELKRFYESDMPSNVSFISVNLTGSESSRAAVSAFVEKEEINYPVLLDINNSVSQTYGVRVLPTTVVLNPDGSIRSARSGAVSFSWLMSFAR